MIEFSELIDILPDPQVRRMEDMGAIAMDMDAVLFFTIDIAADLVPPFQDQALPAGLCISWAKTQPKRPLPTMT